jgi:hypothetical protein
MADFLAGRSADFLKNSVCGFPASHTTWYVSVCLVDDVSVGSVRRGDCRRSGEQRYGDIAENDTVVFSRVNSGHNLEISQTWGFCMNFLNHREGGMVFYQVFLLSPLQKL